jgi:hypothetical protein
LLAISLFCLSDKSVPCFGPAGVALDAVPMGASDSDSASVETSIISTLSLSMRFSSEAEGCLPGNSPRLTLLLGGMMVALFIQFVTSSTIFWCSPSRQFCRPSVSLRETSPLFRFSSLAENWSICKHILFMAAFMEVMASFWSS